MMKCNFWFIFFIGSILVYGQSTTIERFKIDTSNWWKIDYGQDSLASISWNKGLKYAYKTNNYPKKQIKVAILDTDFDLNHNMLLDLIAINKDEISRNNKDDNQNGFVDDYAGWNFLGIKNKDSALAHVLMEETRILRKFDSLSYQTLKKRNKIPFKYIEVKSSFDSIVKSLQRDINPYINIEENYTYVMDTLRKLIPDKISLSSLTDYKTQNDTIMGYVNFAKYYYENDFPYDEFIDYLKLKKLSLDICMNLSYDNRMLLQDKPNNLRDKNYGNPIFGKNIQLLSHGTTVSGVIAHALLDSSNTKNKNTIPNYPIKILPITFTGIGDFTDKDFYLGFKYAISNGANIINISQGKTFSMTPKILFKALKLAKRRNVLVVMSAGNQAMSLDENWRFPQSISKLYEKNFSNVLIVGASSKKLNKNLLDEDSNYGLKSIDIFAPGEDIPTTLPNNEFTTKSGTSFAAPIVTNVAALLWSHYPKLKASEIKKIIMQSGAEYDGLVNVPCDLEKNQFCKNNPQKQKFNLLSRSGKIINALNALKLAEKLTSN